MPNELTNPNNVVTEERLAQFYQQILPYMGGMPEVMMNRFPKGNIYDVDHEVIVGRWIDGKPIYQKTVAYNNKKLYDDYTTLSLNTDPIETVINGIIVFRVDNSGEYDGAMLQVNVYPSSGGTAVQVYKTGTWNASSDRTFYLTAWYTKIGDSAVDIGDDTDYSTTEKIVGTWIDGKPIYQKVISANITLPKNKWFSLSSYIQNAETCISAFGSLVDGSIKYLDYLQGKVDSNGILYIRPERQDWDGSAIWITIQYTKTSS